ncbi:MAG: hypothetical protein KF829_11015 [Ferruginibacter sp.]|nr:hypothetical protein [Ferruginibacter sp.]
MKRKILNWLVPVTVLLVSCSKNNDVQIPSPIQPAKGLYILSEGAFGGNNAKLAYRDNESGTVFPDFFVQQNPTMTAGLGDVGNDMLIYGSKLYIVMNNSGNVTVLNAMNGSFISRISFMNGTTNRNPRYAAKANGKIFVTAYDNTVSVIDTTTLTITQSITVGSNPEQILATDDYLYVANSGGLNYPNVDSTVSIIKLSDLSELRRVTVGLNPQCLAISNQHEILVTGYGDIYGTTPIPAFTAVIDANTNQVVAQLGAGFEYSQIRGFGNTAFFFNNFGNSPIKVYDMLNHSVIRDNFITDGTVITNVYSVDIDEENGNVFICDSKDFVSPGEVFCFNPAGVKQYVISIGSGVNPKRVVFKR